MEGDHVDGDVGGSGDVVSRSKQEEGGEVAEKASRHHQSDAVEW